MTKIDLSLFLKINSLVGHWKLLDWLMMFSAGYLEFLLWIIIIVLFIKNKENRKHLFFAILSAVIAFFTIAQPIRVLINRPRPFEVLTIKQLLEHSSGRSFPSGHAFFYFALATGILKYNKKIGKIFLILATFISFGRVFSGIHYLSDIIAGALMGILSALIFLKLLNRFFKE